MLACALRATDSQGIICGEIERDVMNAADDTTIGAATPDSLLQRIHVVKTWCKATGSRVNWDKSFGVAFSDGPQFELATQHLNIKWASLNQQNPERYLGFLHDLEFREDVMLERVWEKIEKRVTLASHINFALSERVQFLNCYALSCLWYISPLIQVPKEWWTKLKVTMRNFIWQGSIKRIPLEILYLPKAYGGQGLINPEQFVVAQLLSLGAQLLSRNPRSSASVWIRIVDEYCHSQWGKPFSDMIQGWPPISTTPFMLRLFQLCRKHFDLFDPVTLEPNMSVQHFRKKLQYEKLAVKFSSLWKVDVKSWKSRWSMLASLQIAPKLKSFIYTMFWDRLATNKFVAERTSPTLELSPSCTFCDPKVDETIFHLLLECKRTKFVNQQLGELWKEWTGEEIEFNESWLLLDMSNSKYKNTLRQFSIITMWAAWNTRNLRNFKKVDLTDLGVKQYLFSEIRSWLSTLWIDLQSMGLPDSTIQKRMNEILLNGKVGSISSGTLLLTEWSTRVLEEENMII